MVGESFVSWKQRAAGASAARKASREADLALTPFPLTVATTGRPRTRCGLLGGGRRAGAGEGGKVSKPTGRGLLGLVTAVSAGPWSLRLGQAGGEAGLAAVLMGADTEATLVVGGGGSESGGLSWGDPEEKGEGLVAAVESGRDEARRRYSLKAALRMRKSEQ